MKIASFPYETKSSSVFNVIKRPVAEISCWSSPRARWIRYTTIIDTGADYTIFPIKVARDLGINVEKECNQHFTRGIGGSEKVFMLKKSLQVKLGSYELAIPIGFLERDDIPPLLGRHQCLDVFDLHFSRFVTHFSNSMRK